MLIFLIMRYICRKDEIQTDTVRIIPVQTRSGTLSVILANHHGEMVAYENKCPHAWTRLDTVTPVITSGCEQFIQCSSHFAQFHKSNGYCFYGPCEGHSLIKLDICTIGECIYYIEQGS